MSELNKEIVKWIEDNHGKGFDYIQVKIYQAYKECGQTKNQTSVTVKQILEKEDLVNDILHKIYGKCNLLETWCNIYYDATPEEEDRPLWKAHFKVIFDDGEVKERTACFYDFHSWDEESAEFSIGMALV